LRDSSIGTAGPRNNLATTASMVFAIATKLAAGYSAPTPPTFAKDFYTGLQQAVAIAQGGYDIPDGSCCSATKSAQCKVQFISEGSDVREQGSMNRTRNDSPQGTIVTWYGSVKKEMALAPGSAANSSHAFVCAQYCPTQGGFESSVMVGDGQKGFLDKPKYKGKKSVTQGGPAGQTKDCDEWAWTETIFGIIPMEHSQFYVDSSGASPLPFYQSQQLTPFGSKTALGDINMSYLGYSPQDVSSYFDIDPASISTCQQSDNCNQNQQSSTLRHQQAFGKSMRDLALEAVASSEGVAALAALKAAPPPPPPPSLDFGSDYTTTEDSILLINQGGIVQPSGDVCCVAATPGQCQIQLAHQSGTKYNDLTNQRSRFEDGVAGQTIVDDYVKHKSMLINVTAGVETCQEFCPIDPDDNMTKFDPFDPFDVTKDLGPTTWEGKTVEHYQWKDKIFKIVTMEIDDLYVDTSGAKAVPVFLHQTLTPFGQAPIGGQNVTWTNWKVGTPPADKFKIAGVDVCPRSNNCGDQSQQAHRLRSGQLHTFARYEKVFAARQQ